MMTKVFPAHAAKGAKPRTFTFAISTGQLDRDGDRIPVRTWQLSEFRANPVILWSHQHATPPIARATAAYVSGDALKADIEFPPRGIYPFADTVHDLVDHGFLRATSVGFTSRQKTPNGYGGVDYESPVLLEASIVNLPANPGALLERTDRAAVTKWLDGGKEGSMNRWRDDDVLDIEPTHSRSGQLADAITQGILNGLHEALTGDSRRSYRAAEPVVEILTEKEARRARCTDEFYRRRQVHEQHQAADLALKAWIAERGPSAGRGVLAGDPNVGLGVWIPRA